MQDVPIITLDELKQLIDAKGDYVLIDVREEDELRHGMIPTAKHIPLGEVEWALQTSSLTFETKYKFLQPKKSDNLIFHCRTGSRSATATQTALEAGYKARNFKGSIWEWAEIDPLVKRYIN